MPPDVPAPASREGHAPLRRFAVPSARLRPYVDRFWSWTGNADTPLPRILPGTGSELFFHMGAPFAVVDPEHTAPLPPAHFLATRQGAPQLRATGPVSFVAVRQARAACSR